MAQRFPPWFIVAFIFFIFLAQVVAIIWHLYFYIWWLDIPMHIVGGAWVALFALASYYASLRITESEREHSVVFVVAFAIACTLTVGLFWEVYEFGVDHAVGDSGAGLLDTLQDLFNDLIGAILASWMFVNFGYNKKA